MEKKIEDTQLNLNFTKIIPDFLTMGQMLHGTYFYFKKSIGYPKFKLN